jgi:hypothetical protein
MHVGDLVRDEQLVRVGSLVMWNREHSEDYGCMGVVIEHYFEKQDDDGLITEFFVLWADNDRCEYDYEELWKGYIKVVKF